MNAKPSTQLLAKLETRTFSLYLVKLKTTMHINNGNDKYIHCDSLGVKKYWYPQSLVITLLISQKKEIALFGSTKMATMTSCENGLYGNKRN